MARPAQEFFPVEELQACVNAVLRREAAEVLNLGPSDGYPPLKEALLEMLHRDGIAGKDENLLITDGCQQSFDLISKAFVRPGDSVIMENPTYPGAVAIFQGARARCLGVPMRTHAEPGTPLGLDVEALEATLAANRVKLIVLTPDFQNPTGTSMPLVSLRKIYTSRLAALDEALHKHMPEGTRWTRPEGGMCLWLELPPGFDASELLIHVKERGVLFAPGRYFYVQGPLPNTLRLGFASLDEKQIARGVATLAELLKIEMRKRQHGVPRAGASPVH